MSKVYGPTSIALNVQRLAEEMGKLTHPWFWSRILLLNMLDGSIK